MRQYDLIADKLEEVIGNMFYTIKTDHSSPFEYSILFNPNKHSNWFIVLFVKSDTHLKVAMEDGTCYLFHKYLQERVRTDEMLRNIVVVTRFWLGDRPQSEDAYNELFSLLINWHKRILNAELDNNEKICIDCGHSFNDHRLMTFLENNTEAPKEGWITCPVENCACFKTWDAKYKQ